MNKNLHSPVDSYINNFDSPLKEKLSLLHQLISTSFPEAEESISYGMPAYKLHGKPFAYFAGYKNHIGFYATPNTHELFQEELKSYKQGKGSVQFLINQELPLDLIRRMLNFRKESIINA